MHPRYRKRLKELCTQKQLPYDRILSHSTDRVLSYYRRHLLLEFSEEFPNLSTPQLGELFDRNHSSIVIARKLAKDERTKGIKSEWLRTNLGMGISIKSLPAKLIQYAGQ